MLRVLLVNWALLACAFAVTTWLVSGMEVTGGFWSYVWISALFGIVNALVGTILRILALPLTVVTLGLFSLVINAALLEITAALTSKLTIGDFFWTAIWATIILSLVSVLLDVTVGAVLRPKGRALN